MEKTHTTYTSTENLWREHGAYHTENILSSVMEKLHTKYTHEKSTGVDHTRGAENCVEYMDGIIIIDIRKNIVYISPSE